MTSRRPASAARVPTAQTLRTALADAWALIAPVDCAGCGAPDRALCPACMAALRLSPRRALLALHDDAALVPVVAALEYTGAVRAALLALKGDGRTELARPLAGPLLDAVALAWCGAGAAGGVAAHGGGSPAVPPAVLVPVPGSRAGAARRGFSPTALLLSRAGLVAVRGLVALDHGPEQKRRRLAERLDGAHPRFAARTRLRDARVVLVDDVVTSGATLRAAAQALRAVGAEVIGAAALAATPRRHGVSRIPWEFMAAHDEGPGDNVGVEG